MRTPTLFLLVAGLFAAGCQTHRPGYVEPRYSLAHSVTLKGLRGTYVQEIDQLNVSDAQVQFADVGWNTVLADPGEHHLRVTLNRTVGDQIATRTVGFSFLCDAGHVYEFSPCSPAKGLLKVTDANTNRSLVIDRSDEPPTDDPPPPAGNPARDQVASGLP